GPRAGLLAGSVYALLPVTGQYALEARSYALVAASAVLATVVLVAGLRSGRALWFGLYTLLLTATAILHLFAFLLVAAHAVTVLTWQAPARTRRLWLIAAAAAAVLLVPLAWLASTERSAIEWIRPPDAEHLWTSVLGITGGVGATALAALLCLNGAFHRRDLATLRVAVPWAVVPTLLLLALSAAEPVFVARYLLFCVPAVALLIALGLDALPVPAALTSGLALLLLTAPASADLRRPDSKWHDITPIVRALDRQARPGDGFLAAPANGRLLASAYPDVFAPITDLALAEPGPVEGTLTGTELTGRPLARRLEGPRRVWLIERFNANSQARSRARAQTALLTKAGFAPSATWRAKRMRLTLFARR
ncbi:hypothetical protein, partial [Actinocorallia lasiicapitis]